MGEIVEAIHEGGVLRLLQPLAGVPEHARVRITVEPETTSPHPLAGCIGILPDDDAAEMLQIIEDEFERIDPDEWQ